MFLFSILQYVDHAEAKSSLKFAKFAISSSVTILFLTSMFYFALNSVLKSFIIHILFDYAAMHFNAGLR